MIMLLAKLKALKFTPSTSQVLLAAALGIGLLAGWGAYHELHARQENLAHDALGKTVQLIVARSDLPVGALLSARNLAVRDIPLRYAPGTGLPPSGFDALDGRKLAYPMRSGEVVSIPLLAPVESRRLSTYLEPGHRALTVAVGQIDSFDGMLKPDDRIDVMLTVTSSPMPAVYTIEQRLPVLATGQKVNTRRDAPLAGTYDTVTLDVTPRQAHRLVIARSLGTLTFLLRPTSDTALLPGPPPAINALLDGLSQPVSLTRGATATGSNVPQAGELGKSPGQPRAGSAQPAAGRRAARQGVQVIYGIGAQETTAAATTPPLYGSALDAAAGVPGFPGLSQLSLAAAQEAAGRAAVARHVPPPPGSGTAPAAAAQPDAILSMTPTRRFPEPPEPAAPELPPGFPMPASPAPSTAHQ